MRLVPLSPQSRYLLVVLLVWPIGAVVNLQIFGCGGACEINDYVLHTMSGLLLAIIWPLAILGAGIAWLLSLLGGP